MRRILLLISLALSAPTFAQQKGFFSVETGTGSSLRLSDIESDVKLDGAFAETTLDLAYANDSATPLQGLFKIQLPRDSVVRDFALRIGEKWQLGSLTEKHKARQTFEEVVRGGADPAVLAWSNGTDYQVRIFPFPPKGKRHIRIRYWQEIPGADGKFVYEMPLPTGVKMDTFRLKLNAHASSLDGVQVGEGFAKLAYLKPIGEEKNSFGAILDEKAFTIPGNFRISAQQRSPLVWTGAATPKGDMTYAGALFFSDLPASPRPPARRLLVFLDTSRFAKPDQPAATAKVLKKLTGAYAQVSYYEFDASVRKVEQLDAEQTEYDGGTDFQSVLDEIATQRKLQKLDIDVLLLTDAIPSMQRAAELTNTKIDGAKIFVLPTKSNFNPHFAATLSEKSGGIVLPVVTANAVDSIVSAYTHLPWRIEGFHFDDGSATDVYPEPGSIVESGDIAVYFRSKPGLLPQNATLVVTNGSDRRELKANFKDVGNVPEIENLWAMRKLSSLIPHLEDLAKDLAAHAVRYQLISPETSYIVLENEWDYQRFNITQREENLQASPNVRMKGGTIGTEYYGAEGLGKSAGVAAAAEPMTDVGVAKRAIGIPTHWPIVHQPAPSPVAKSEHDDLSTAIALSEDVHHYAKGFLLFGKLDRLYAEKNTPEMKDAWFFVEMAQAFLAKGQKQKASRVISNLFEISEEDGKSLRTMGLAGCFDGDCTLAVRALTMAIALRPEEPQNYRDLAWLYVEQGRLSEAQAAMEQIKGKVFHSRFPGMDQLIARETEWIDALAKGDSRGPAAEVGTYSWITWNNDNSDIDFHVRESKDHVVWFQNRNGRGQLSNDFTQGYGPEIYMARENLSPNYFVHYFRADRTTESQAVVVKFATIERGWDGKLRIRSQLFPLYTQKEYVRVN